MTDSIPDEELEALRGDFERRRAGAAALLSYEDRADPVPSIGGQTP